MEPTKIIKIVQNSTLPGFTNTNNQILQQTNKTVFCEIRIRFHILLISVFINKTDDALRPKIVWIVMTTSNEQTI